MCLWIKFSVIFYGLLFVSMWNGIWGLYGDWLWGFCRCGFVWWINKWWVVWILMFFFPVFDSGLLLLFVGFQFGSCKCGSFLYFSDRFEKPLFWILIVWYGRGDGVCVVDVGVLLYSLLGVFLAPIHGFFSCYEGWFFRRKACSSKRAGETT